MSDKPSSLVPDLPAAIVPAWLQPAAPTVSLDIVVDAQMPAVKLARALASCGLRLINTTDGRFVITERPEAWRL